MKVERYNRAMSFSSVEAMDEHDAEIAALLEKHEGYRHQCEVRTLLRVTVHTGSWDAVAAYYEVVERKRGRQARERLAQDVRAQWLAGNRGNKDDWRLT